MKRKMVVLGLFTSAIWALKQSTLDGGDYGIGSGFPAAGWHMEHLLGEASVDMGEKLPAGNSGITQPQSPTDNPGGQKNP